MTTRILLACALLGLLASCGGGYGGGGSGGTMSCSGGAYSGGSCVPTGTLAAPAGSLSGSVALSVTPSVPSGASVTSVQFRVDGIDLGAAVSAAPYSVNWDTTGVADGAHTLTAVIADSANLSGTTPALSVTVANQRSFSVTLDAALLYPAPATSGSGSATLGVNIGTGAVTGSVTLSGVTATAVELGDAYAGASSAAVLTLVPDAANAGTWNVAPGATLDAAQRQDLLAGRLYLLVRSAAFPDGELRGQVTPPNITVRVVALSGAQEVPAVTSSASGMAAVTVDGTADTAAVHVHTSGLASISGAQLLTGAAGSLGTTLAALDVDATDPQHWLKEGITLSGADLGNFNSGDWYVNVFDAAHSAGEIRGQVTAPVTAATLSELQATIFGPMCSGCHNGAGSALPGSQNLSSAAATYAAVVNVASEEQPALLRVKPGDPDNSYLVRKIEGAASISGSRMPVGGALTQAQIDQVRSWVAAGAQNN